MTSRRTNFTITALVLLALLMGACTPPAAPTAPAAPAATSVPAVTQPTTAPAAPEPTQPAPTAVPAVTSGGDFVFAISAEPDTLDPQKTGSGVSDLVLNYLGGALVAKSPAGEYVPFLAESWTASEDGLVWDFKLREDIKFHNGDPLTAEDYAWTFNRAIDPETASPSSGPSLGPVDKIEAVDTYTLRLTLKEPFYPIIDALSGLGYMQPLNKRAVEAGGDQYGRNPVGVGPYKFKEWVTGSKVVLERNPDFTWYPGYAEGKEWKLDTLEFRFIPEYSTILAGLEAGEIDFAAIETKDLPTFQDNPQFTVLEAMQQGLRPYVTLNVSKPPFDDINVRKAFNKAIDREGMVSLLIQNHGTPQEGPLTPSQLGYSDAVEGMGYTFDLEGAKADLQAAGYTQNASGMWEKGGQPLELTLYTLPVDAWVKAAEFLQQNLADLGVEVTIEQQDQGVLIPTVMGGTYEMSMMGMTSPEADILFLMFHSSNAGGGLNLSQVNDPVLDEMLQRTRTETDPAARQAAVDEVQTYIVEQALVLPLYIPINFSVMSNAVKDYVFSAINSYPYLEGAYKE